MKKKLHFKFFLKKNNNYSFKTIYNKFTNISPINVLDRLTTRAEVFHLRRILGYLHQPSVHLLCRRALLVDGVPALDQQLVHCNWTCLEWRQTISCGDLLSHNHVVPPFEGQLSIAINLGDELCATCNVLCPLNDEQACLQIFFKKEKKTIFVVGFSGWNCCKISLCQPPPSRHTHTHAYHSKRPHVGRFRVFAMSQRLWACPSVSN